MSNIFYFFGLILTLINIGFVVQFFKMEKIREWSIKFKRVTSKEPLPIDFKKGEYDLLKTYTFYIIFNFIWLFIGLINTDWRICGVILLFSLLLNQILNFLLYLINQLL